MTSKEVLVLHPLPLLHGFMGTELMDREILKLALPHRLMIPIQEGEGE